MSKINLTPNASGTGVFTIASPNSNTDRTLDLPDEAGTILSNTSDIESQVKTATNASGSAPIYSCRAWVNFVGTGTVAISDSGNVSSITDNGTGSYTVNFTTAMEDANYSVVTAAGTPFGDRATLSKHSYTTAGARLDSVRYTTAVAQVDIEDCNVAIFR